MSKPPLRFASYLSQPIPKFKFTFEQSKTPGPKISFPTKKKSPSPSHQRAGPPPTHLNKVLNELWRKLSQKDQRKIFAQPVSEDIAPGYFSVIKNPMDLSTIKTKIQHSEYYSLHEFSDDVYLMLTNSLTYNPEGSLYHKLASDLLEDFSKNLKSAKNQLKGDAAQSSPAASIRSYHSMNVQSNRDIVLNDRTIIVDEPTRPVKPTKLSTQMREGQSIDIFSVPEVPPEYQPEGASSRLAACYSTLSQATSVSQGLSVLQSRFSSSIAGDAIQKLAGTPSLPPDPPSENTTSQTFDHPRIVIADTTSEAVQALGRKLPEFQSFPIHDITVSPPAFDLERLMMFTHNTLHFWADPAYSAAKATLNGAITSGLVDILLESPPKIFMTPKEVSLLGMFFPKR